ncbi:Cro/CI family transcriptional regulator [Pseudomonas mosselii]|uniref:Cro/CI family transcriptional regulator n=1 Tax=Pseudomonas mosselii TaxID=78327 RepID=UPI001F30475D|nr:Cro/CI family transcriptional regulator [Pseudomonas mosselii]
MSEQPMIAEDVTPLIDCAREQLNWMRSVLHVLEERLRAQGDKHGALVANLAIHNADDWHNYLGDQHESLMKRIEAALSAPQKMISENCGAADLIRLPLAEFARGRQDAAARDLGVQQAVISEALRVGRTIFVTRHADGSCSAYEERPFPSQRVGGAA